MSAPERRLSTDYWTIVFRQFRRRKLAVAASFFIAGLFLCAIFAPFIASQRPLFMSGPQGARFPVLAELTRSDWIWLWALLAAIAGRVAYGRWKRRAPERAFLAPAAGLALVVFAAGTVVITASVRSTADRTDWEREIAAAKSANATVLMPPVPFGPYEGKLLQRLKEPGVNGHLLGTDDVGRDILSRMVWGTRVSLIVGFVAVSIYVTIGIIVGALAGFFGGKVDILVSRVIEVVMCFPVFFLILAVLAFLPPSIFNIMILIGLTGWTNVARLTRGEFLRLKNGDFVTAGVAMGASSPRLIFRHVLPNSLAPVLVSATFGIAGAILLEAGLSFLGFGVPPPTASWGSILYGARPYVSTHPWLPLYPGLAIFLTVTAYNLAGEALRDALDPRLSI